MNVWSDKPAETNIACTCTVAKTGTSSTRGGKKPVLILELYADDCTGPLVEFFNCTISAKGNYSVRHDSNFARLYRLTNGAVDRKRYSKAQQLLKHFQGKRFFASYQWAQTQDGSKSYWKVTRLEPEQRQFSDEWTPDGRLIITPKKATEFLARDGDETQKKATEFLARDGEKVAKKWRKSGEKVAKKWRQNGDGETLETAETLGLEAHSGYITTYPIQHECIIPLCHVVSSKPELPVGAELTLDAVYSEMDFSPANDDSTDLAEVDAEYCKLAVFDENTTPPAQITPQPAPTPPLPPKAPTTQLKTRAVNTCKGCAHFKSYFEHGGGIGDCDLKAMPMAIKPTRHPFMPGRWLAETRHVCSGYERQAQVTC